MEPLHQSLACRMRAVRIANLLPLTLCLFACFCGDSVDGQVVGAAVAASPRDEIRQASLSAAPSIVNARRDAAENFQIRVKVQYLLVDAETRAAIYQGLDRNSIVSSVQTPLAAEEINLEETVSSVTSLQHILAPSRVTTYTLSEAEFAGALQKAIDSPSSQFNAAPKVILLDGNDVEMTDLVQRPFVIDFQLDGETVKPSVHVLEEGTRLRMVGYLTDPAAGSNQDINLKCELTVMRVLDIKTDQVFGIKDEPLTVHLPFQQINSAVATRRLAAGQALLIDPHVSQSRSVESETGIPMFGRKIPYLSRAFKNVSKATVEQHMMLVLQPSVEPMVR